MLARTPGGRRHKPSGAIALMASVAMLSLMLTTAAAIASLMLAGRQAVSWRLEREIAFRQAEVALLDAQADLRAALADPRRRRLSPIPAAGNCGTGIQRGVCTPSARTVPPWEAWLAAPMTIRVEPGVPVGTFTGTRMPAIAVNAGGATQPPRYLIEVLSGMPSGSATAARSAAPAGDPIPDSPDAALFRITAIGYGRDPAARAVLQTHWLGPSSTPSTPGTPGARRRSGRVGWRELVAMP